MLGIASVSTERPTAEARRATAQIASVALSGAVELAANPMVQAGPPISDAFDFPVGSYGGFGMCPDDKGASSCYWLCRGFQKNVNSACQETGYGDHLGEDWNRGSISSPDDYGDPVYAVASGEVVFAQADVPIALSTKNWGKVIIIRHTLPDGTQVESQYGHLKDMLVTAGAIVTRGQQIATIGDGDGRWASHLHFEIRYSNCPYWGAAGPAWRTIATGWGNPSNFINSHRTLQCGFEVGEGTIASEMTAFATAHTAAGGQAVLGCPTAPVDMNGFTSLSGTTGHRQSFAAGEIQFLTNGNNAGQAFAVLAPMDAKWNSLVLNSSNPLGYAIGNRTALLSSCFGTRRISQPFEGGSLEYHLTDSRAESVYEVHGPIYAKWSQQGFAQCPLGMPISDVQMALTSGASGNTGSFSDFQGGSIYSMDSSSEAFAVHSGIKTQYILMGGSASWIGFPTSDQYVSGNQPRQDFEAGYITTTDGINFQAFPTGSPQGADLSVTIDDAPDPTLLETNLTYNILVTNHGPNNASGVVLTDALPVNLTFVSATPSQGNCSGTTTVSCNLGSLVNGASASVTLVVKTKSVGTAANTASVRAFEYDADAVAATVTGNNIDTEFTLVDPKTDLSITKTVASGILVVGQNVTYTLVAKNLGPSPATGVTVVDQLPASLTFVSASSTTGTCSETGGTVNCSVGDLAKNATATVTLIATTTIGGTLSNTANVFGHEADLNASNNTVTRTSSVRTLNSLTFTPSTVAGCITSVGKVTLTGSAPVGGVEVALSSSAPVATVPPTVTIPSGSTSTTFTVTTVAVPATEPVTITATLGPASKSSTLTLRTIGVQSLTLNPNPASGGSSVTGTITLECIAAPGDVTVTVTSSINSVANVPSSVIVPAGALSQNFTITAGNVASTSSSTIRASASGTSSSVVLNVEPGNQAPVVDAGADQTITLPASASLSGTVTDDGLPSPPATITTTWSMISGPGTVTFANGSLVNTSASFSTAGTYVLRLTADDSALSSSDDLSVTVNAASTTNQAPVVDAGPDKTITLPSSATLNGSVMDDGLPNPPNSLTVVWTKLTGPGTVSFTNPDAVSSTANFSASGVYVLQFTADDSALSSSDTVTVTVNDGGGVPAPQKFFDHFLGSTLDPARWISQTSNGGSLTVTDSYVETRTDVDAGTSYFYPNAKLDKSKSQLWVFNINNHSASNGDFITLINSATAPSAGSFATLQADTRVRVSRGTKSTTGLVFHKFDSSGTRTTWTSSTNAWQTPTTFAVPRMATDDYYIVGFEIDGPGARWRLMAWCQDTQSGYNFNQGYRMFALTDWVAWDSMAASDDLWLVIGDLYTDVNAHTTRVEWIRYADGSKTHGWVNGKTTLGSAYSKIKHWYSYDNEFWVPEDRTGAAIAVGSSGAWDDAGVKDKTVIVENGTYYMFYLGNDGSFLQLGLATATSPDGPWIKDPNNPLITRVAGGDESTLGTPFLLKDEQDGDANKRWKLFYNGVNLSGADPVHRIFLATAPAPAGPWTKQGAVLEPGVPGEFDELGCSNPVVFFHDGRWEIWYAGQAAGGGPSWSVARATTSNLNNIPYTKDTANNPFVSRWADSVQNLSANLTHRTASMTDTTGFVPEQMIKVNQDTNPDNWSISRIRKVNTNSGLELYHSLSGFNVQNNAQVRGFDAGSVTIHHIENRNGKWYFYVTLFGLFESHSTFEAFGEHSGLMSSTNLLDKPKTFEWLLTPTTTLTAWDHLRSSENIAILRGQ